jgi:hypothetical protein
MHEDNGFGFGIWSLFKVIKVTIGAQTADDFGTRGSINGLALRTNGDFTVIADADLGLLAPDEGPPRTGWERAQGGMFLGESLLLCSERSHSQFSVDFMSVDVWEQLIVGI